MKRLIAIAMLVALRAPAHADPASDARALVEAKDFGGAAKKFLEAYQLSAEPDLICNAGVAYYKAGAFHRAHLFLGRCLERSSALEAEFVKQVHAVLSSVEEALHAGNYAPVDVTVDPAGTAIAIAEFGAEAAFVGSRTVWLPFGTHVVVATATGMASSTQTVEIADHAARVLTFKLAPAPIGEPKRIAPPPPPPTPIEHRSKLPAIAVSAGAIAAGVFTAIAYGRAHDHADLAPYAVSTGAYDREVASTHHWNQAMVTGAAVTAVGAGIAGYLWYAALHAPGEVEIVPTSGGAAVTFGGRW